MVLQKIGISAIFSLFFAYIFAHFRRKLTTGTNSEFACLLHLSSNPEISKQRQYYKLYQIKYQKLSQKNKNKIHKPNPTTNKKKRKKEMHFTIAKQKSTFPFDIHTKSKQKK